MTREVEQSSAEPLQPAETGIDPGLVPMYELSEADYIGIINDLANLTIEIVQVLHGFGNEEAARALARAGSGILARYDPDVAELVRGQIFSALSDEVTGDAEWGA